MKEVLGYDSRRFSNFGEVNLEFIVGKPVFAKQCVHASAREIFNYGSSARTSLENACRNNPQYELYVQTGRQYALASCLYYLKRNRSSL